MKIYYQYGDFKTISSNRGDFINETNTIMALKKFADVFYSGNSPAKKYPISIEKNMLRGNYDLYIVRNNKTLFSAIPKNKPKIWMSSPYDLECFRKSTAIGAFTKAWENLLREGRILGFLNPNGKRFDNVVTIYQTIADEFRPLQNDPKTIRIREEIDADIIVGHFGRIANTTYPYLLLSVWEELISRYPRMKLVFGVNNGKVDTIYKNILHKTIAHSDMPYYISACDIVVVSQHGREWDVCGNLKVKEPAACGVPVILQRSLARIEEYGNDYPLFLPESYCDLPITEEKRNCMINKFDQVIEDINFRKDISERLISKMKFYSMEESSKRLEQDILRIISRK